LMILDLRGSADSRNSRADTVVYSLKLQKNVSDCRANDNCRIAGYV
jgi:hypothetical protein